MMSFRGNYLSNLTVPTSTLWLMNDIAESKGRQELYTKQSPQLLKALRETALIQSVESSNRIEGVTVAAARLRPLVLGNTRPRDRPEQEIQGYRRALNLIHTGSANLHITPDAIRQLHFTIQEGGGDAGQWKQADNEIIELRPGSAPVIRFRPVPAFMTSEAMDELCLSYRHITTQQAVPPLLTVACLVLDFLCIHPFRDGNCRVSRLLTLLTLYHHGYEAGRYISLERLIEESREDYYEALRLSSEGWHERRHDLVPWLNYFLAIVRRAYREFEQRVGEIKSPRGAKTDLITNAISRVNGTFSVADIQQQCPGVSVDLIRHVLKNLRPKVECLGRGHKARWQKTKQWD